MLLSDAIDLYRADRAAKGAAKTTVKNEQCTLRQLLAVVGNIQVHYVQVRHVDKLWAAHPDWSVGTWNLKRIHLGTFFKWCRTRSIMPRTTDPLEGLKQRRVPKVQRSIVPQSKFEELLEAAPNPRDRMAVALGLYLFTRVSETAALKWRDIDFDNKTVAVYRTKTEEFDILPMCEELEIELRRWRFEYGRQVREVPRNEWYVVPALSPPRFSGKGGKGLYMVQPPMLRPHKRFANITSQVKIVLDKLGYDDTQEGGHTLRRSGATALYHELSKLGHDRAIRMCQAMLGHKHIATTEIYLSLDLDRKTRNDLLAGKRMFAVEAGDVVDLEALDGEANVGAL